MYIKVTVKTGVKKEFFMQKSENHFEIAVKEKAERNMANTRIVELVAEYFEVAVKKVRIVNGHRHSSKLLVVEL